MHVLIFDRRNCNKRNYELSVFAIILLSFQSDLSRDLMHDSFLGIFFIGFPFFHSLLDFRQELSVSQIRLYIIFKRKQIRNLILSLKEFNVEFLSSSTNFFISFLNEETNTTTILDNSESSIIFVYFRNSNWFVNTSQES